MFTTLGVCWRQINFMLRGVIDLYWLNMPTNGGPGPPKIKRNVRPIAQVTVPRHVPGCVNASSRAWKQRIFAGSPGLLRLLAAAASYTVLIGGKSRMVGRSLARASGKLDLADLFPVLWQQMMGRPGFHCFSRFETQIILKQPWEIFKSLSCYIRCMLQYLSM